MGDPKSLADTIRRHVASYRALSRTRHATAALLAVSAVLSAGVLSGAALVTFGTSALWLRLLFYASWVLTAVVAALLALRAYLRDGGIRGFASLLERKVPAFRNDITSSLSFAETLAEYQDPVTKAMVVRVLKKTEEGMHAHETELVQAVPQPPTRLAWSVLGATMAAMALWGLVDSTSFTRGVQTLLAGLPETAAEVVTGARRATLVANIVVTTRAPAYSGIGDRMTTNSTGQIDVLRGTEVTLEALAVRDLASAEIVLTTSGADGTPNEQIIRLERRQGGRLVATFTPLHSGTYTIRGTLPDGEAIEDGIERELSVRLDAPPQVTIEHPEAEVDVAPDEVVRFAYNAQDDFGLSEVAIVVAFAGDQKSAKRTVVKRLDGTESVVPGDVSPTPGTPQGALRGDHKLDLAPFNLKPKDRLVVHFEAVDNDAVEGAKVGTSETVVLYVSSAEDKHLEILEEEKELVEGLITLLGDFLEQPIGMLFERGTQMVMGVPDTFDTEDIRSRFQSASTTHASAVDLSERMANLKERMEQDPLMLKRDFDLFAGVQEDFSDKVTAENLALKSMSLAAEKDRYVHSDLRRVFERRKLTIRSTEQAILRLEDLIAAQQMASALDTAKSLKEAKERLKELLQKYKDNPDPELRAEIMREIQRLKERMAELMAKLQSQVQNLPQEHVNMEALEREELGKEIENVGDAMQKVQDLLEKGDIEGALAELDNLSDSIDSMTSSLEDQFEEAQPEGLSELDKNVSELMDKINDLSEQEKEIAEATDELAKEMEKRQQEAMQDALEDVVKEQLETLKQIEDRMKRTNPDGLRPHDQEAFEAAQKQARSLKQALENKDVFDALQKATELSRDMKKAQQRVDLNRKFSPKGSPQKQAYERTGDTLDRSAPQAESIERALRELMDNARPKPSGQESGRMQQLGEQQEQVAEQLAKLRQRVGEMSQEFPSIGEQLGGKMGEAQKFMDGAKRRLQSQEGRKAHQNEEMALQQFDQMKESLRQTLKKEKMGPKGRRNSDEKVVIPDANPDAPKAFRKDIMDAMKEDRLDDYEGALREYYESLVR